MKTIQEILGARNLCGVINAIKAGVPKVLPPSFYATTRGVEGDHCTYTLVEGTRQTARLVQFGSPSVRRGLRGIKEKAVKLLHSKEHVIHKPATLLNLRNMDSEQKQKLGRQEITRQSADFKQLFTNLRIAAVTQALALGVIYFDDEGNLLPSSSNAVFSLDMQVPANNKNQLNSIIAASWATAGTAIHTHIIELKKAALKATGYALEYAFYGEDILGYFLANTALKEIIWRTPVYQKAFTEGEIPNGFLGLQWIPAYGAFYNDAAGSDQDLWAGDKIVFTPEPSPEWWEIIEGSYPVPTEIGIVGSDAVAALGNIDEVTGMFQYAELLSDPVTIKQIAGDTFLPIIKVPAAIYIADVVV